MRVTLAPQLGVSHEIRALSTDVLEAMISVEIDDESEAPIAHLVRELIRKHSPELAAGPPQSDSPRLTADDWWLAFVWGRLDGRVEIESADLGNVLYGLDERGRVKMDQPNGDTVTVAEFCRAVSAGHYATSERTLIVTSPGEFGGGPEVVELVMWIAKEVPWVLAGLAAGRLTNRHDLAQEERRQLLATNWAQQRIESPDELRRFVETRPTWYPEALAVRLSLNDEAASRLLEALGYEPTSDGAMTLRSSLAALTRRDHWVAAELSATYDKLYGDMNAFLDPDSPKGDRAT